MSDLTADASPVSVDLSTLADFTLNLAKAMLRTGYYAPGHPEAEQSLEGLHEQFRRTVGDRSWLTYLVSRTGETETVMVQGVGEEAQTLGQLMIRGMAELFEPKFLDFFHRRHLVSFSLSSPIGAAELSAFVALMSEPPKAGRVDEERERVERFFLDENIINVSTVFESDILGRERDLPWRVQLALSRLGRDLRMLPLFERASAEEVQRVKIQILDDLIRPLKAPELVKDFLLHCDLLATDIGVLESAQIEREIIAQLPLARLSATCQVIVDELMKVRSDDVGAGDELIKRRHLILRHVLTGLIAAEAELDSEMVEACVKLGVSTFEELPKKIRNQLLRRRAVDSFLVRKEEYLEAFGHIPPTEEGAKLAKTGEVFFAELLNRELYLDAASILEAVKTGNQEKEAAAAARGMIEHFREVLSDEDTLRPILERLNAEGQDKGLTEALIHLTALAGKPAAEPLLTLYRDSESRSVKSHAFEAIKEIGAVALIPFLNDIAQMEDEWAAIHHILSALSGVDEPLLAGPIRTFLGHENAHVRQAALTRIFELEGEGAEEQLIEALGDPDPAVRHTGVAHLGSLGSQHPEALAYFTSVLNPASRATSTETSDEVLVEICRSLASIVEASSEHSAGFEEILMNALTLSDKGGLLNRLRKSTPHFSERVRIAICEALGAVGTESSLMELEKLSEDEGAVAEASIETMKRIRGGDNAQVSPE